MLKVICQRKRRWIGHELRQDQFRQEIIELRVTGKPYIFCYFFQLLYIFIMKIVHKVGGLH